MVEFAGQDHSVAKDHLDLLVVGEELRLDEGVEGPPSSPRVRESWGTAVVARDWAQAAQGVVHLVLDRLEVLVGGWDRVLSHWVTFEFGGLFSM